MSVEKVIVLNMHALNAGAEVVNNLDYEVLVEAMYDPVGHRGVVEDVLTRAWAPAATRLRRLPS